MSYINEAKDEIWSVLKKENEDYFVVPTQSTDQTQTTYFPRDLNNNPLTTLLPTSRSYLLPTDLREVKFIEVTTPGLEQRTFEYRRVTDVEFKVARRSSSIDQTPNPTNTYLYTILGSNRFEMAQFPESNLSLVLWYVQSIPDVEAGDPVASILLPYSKKIADYAVKKAMLGMQDPSQFALWVEEWKADVLTVATSAGPRNQADAEFVEDFLG